MTYEEQCDARIAAAQETIKRERIRAEELGVLRMASDNATERQWLLDDIGQAYENMADAEGIIAAFSY